MHSQVHDRVAELFLLRLDHAAIQQLIEGSEEVHAFFTNLEGYCGMEILILGEFEVQVHLRWIDYTHFDRNLPFILNACPVKAWLNLAQAVTHRPAILRTFHQNHIEAR